MGTKQVRRPERADPPSTVDERILSTATDLFYREGVRAVGIQRVIDEAGIAKASLYAHYASKDDLVAACIVRRGAAVRAAIEARLATPGLDARGKLLAIFDAHVESVARPDFRGCPFLNASSELADPDHPAKRAIAGQRAWLHHLMARLVKEARAPSPDRLAGAVVVLFDGASSSSLVDGDPGAARQARWAAEQLLGAHVPRSRRPHARRASTRRRQHRSVD